MPFFCSNQPDTGPATESVLCQHLTEGQFQQKLQRSLGKLTRNKHSLPFSALPSEQRREHWVWSVVKWAGTLVLAMHLLEHVSLPSEEYAIHLVLSSDLTLRKLPEPCDFSRHCTHLETHQLHPTFCSSSCGLFTLKVKLRKSRSHLRQYCCQMSTRVLFEQ